MRISLSEQIGAAPANNGAVASGLVSHCRVGPLEEFLRSIAGEIFVDWKANGNSHRLP